METQLSPSRFSLLGSGMIGELVQRLGEPKGKKYEEKYGDSPEWCGAFVPCTSLVWWAFFLLAQATGGQRYSIKYYSTFYIITDNSDG